MKLPLKPFAAALLVVVANGQPIPFADSFEDDKGWFLFEEIVGENPCYAKGIGEMGFSTERAFSGKRSLRLWANKTGSDKSNHLIAVKRMGNTGWSGKWTYSVHVYIPPNAESYQTGPEISIQNTRRHPSGDFLTHTAAIQYQANHFLERTGAWAVWREKSPGVAAWESIFDHPLKPATWYRLSLEVDYDNNRYGWFTVEGAGAKQSVDLSNVVMAGEKRYLEEAFAITLEGENLWSNCGTVGSYQQQFFYDDITLAPTKQPAVIGVYPSLGTEAKQRFQFRFQASSEDRPLSVVNMLINRTLDSRSACHLAYSVAPNVLLLMNDTGEDSVDSMPGTSFGILNNRQCKVTGSSAVMSGLNLILEIEIAFDRAVFAGNQTIFLAARDTHGGNSGWVTAGSWVVEPVTSR
jgi:hypothetical protein